VPRYDAPTDTFTVDWPGRPAGTLPRFKTLDEARSYIMQLHQQQLDFI